MNKFLVFATLGMAICGGSQANFFELKSDDLKPNKTIPLEYVFSNMGCRGKNKSPELHWTGVPKGTESFAVTVYDPDAPTGSGWWHWIVINLPLSTTHLKRGWSTASDGSGLQISNDFGTSEYGGPCPPTGKPHHYIFTVYALNQKQLEIPKGASHASVRFMIQRATIKKASFTSLYAKE